MPRAAHQDQKMAPMAMAAVSPSAGVAMLIVFMMASVP